MFKNYDRYIVSDVKMFYLFQIILVKKAADGSLAGIRKFHMIYWALTSEY